MQNWLLILSAVAVGALRLIVPTVGHSWPMVFIAFSHIWVGILIILLWQARGKWPLGWICLSVPTLIEAVMFALH